MVPLFDYTQERDPEGTWLLGGLINKLPSPFGMEDDYSQAYIPTVKAVQNYTRCILHSAGQLPLSPTATITLINGNIQTTPKHLKVMLNNIRTSFHLYIAGQRLPLMLRGADIHYISRRFDATLVCDITVVCVPVETGSTSSLSYHFVDTIPNDKIATVMQMSNTISTAVEAPIYEILEFV